MMLSIGICCYGAHMRCGTPTMNDPWGELTRQSFDERCRLA